MTASVSVGLLDPRSGLRLLRGEDRGYPCASVVKVSILVALLLRARDEGRALGERERSCARAMIERSDNDTASELYAAVGGPAGLDAAHARLGLTATRAHRAWGLTRTTVADQLVLLDAVFRDFPYAALLMGRVVDGQSWGVSVAGCDWALKNGWMPMKAEDDRWVVHSVGRAGGALIAVLSDGHPDRDSGIAAVEAAVRDVVREAGP
ncbi:hypothetical protein ABT160_18405 [Streptomyces sp. NPDC001941]|uniref:hypothetical protein n=1 Tax=Streptomyces sp. NPDC001941 TaxID=3154659 RepID=UPI00332CE02E